MWLVLALVAALCQVLRNTVMKRLGHSLDEYINVWGRFTFLLPFARRLRAVEGRAGRSSRASYLACVCFAVCQTISTMSLSKALKLSEISMVTALWKVSLLVLVVLGYFTLKERPTLLGIAGHPDQHDAASTCSTSTGPTSRGGRRWRCSSPTAACATPCSPRSSSRRRW